MHPPIKSEGEKVRSARAQRDVELVEAALAGNAKSYEGLLTIYRRSVYGVVLKMVPHPDDAEDLTIEAFAKAFRHLSRYTPEYAFSTWLFRIATNHAIDFVRRKQLVTQSLSRELELVEGEGFLIEMPDQNLNPQDAYIRQQRIAVVQQAVAQLPSKYLRLVHLRYFEELSYEEITVVMAIPLGTVKAQLFRARELLLTLLKNSQDAF